MHRWLSLLAMLPLPALAQSTTSSPPLTIDIVGVHDGETITSPDQQNHSASMTVSLFCAFNMTSHTGDANAKVVIDGKGSGVYFNLLDSPTIGIDNQPLALFMGPGIGEIPGLNKSIPVPPIWRARVVIDKKKTGGVVNGQLNCRVK